MKAKISRQKGFTLIELLIVVAVIAVLALGANAGLNLRNDQVGANEGKAMNFAVTCIQTKTSQPTYVSATMAAMANLGCFQDELVTGKGTAAATATSNLVGAAYTVTPVNLNGTKDGIALALAGVLAKNCNGLVKAAGQGGGRIIVTPLSGTASTVKTLNSGLDDTALGLACNSATSATVEVTGGPH